MLHSKGGIAPLLWLSPANASAIHGVLLDTPSGGFMYHQASCTSRDSGLVKRR